MFKKVILSVMVLSLICTGAVFANASEETAASAASAFNIDAPAEKTVVDVIGWTFPITDFYRTQFEELNDVENLEVNVQYLNGSGAQEQVRLALSGGKKSPYEVVHAANAQISEWGFPGWLMPLNDLVEKYWDEYDLGDIPQTAWDAATVDGDILGIPVVSNSFQLIYRADLFEKHGIAVPETYDEVIAAAKKLKADEPSIDVPFAINLHAAWAWEIEFFQMLGAYGGKFLNEDNTPAFNGPEGVAAVEMLVRVAEEAMGPEGLSYSVDDVEIGLQTGRLAFANTWASRAVNMNNPDESLYVDELKFAVSPAAVPGGKVTASAWNDFYCIPENLDGIEAELVFQVIMEAADLESQSQAIEFGIPTRMKSLESDLAGAYMAASMGGVAQGVGAYMVNPAIPLIRTALQAALPQVMTGKSAQEVLDMAAESYVEEAKANGYL